MKFSIIHNLGYIKYENIENTYKTRSVDNLLDTIYIYIKSPSCFEQREIRTKLMESNFVCLCIRYLNTTSVQTVVLRKFFLIANGTFDKVNKSPKRNYIYIFSFYFHLRRDAGVELKKKKTIIYFLALYILRFFFLFSNPHSVLKRWISPTNVKIICFPPRFVN